MKCEQNTLWVLKKCNSETLHFDPTLWQNANPRCVWQCNLDLTNTANQRNATNAQFLRYLHSKFQNYILKFSFYLFYLLGHFEDSQQPQGSETRKTEGTGPLLKVDPKDFKNGSSDDGKVKAVEGGGEVNKDS